MDKFFFDLEEVLEKYNHDVTALDDYEVTAYHSTKFVLFSNISTISVKFPPGGGRLCSLNNLGSFQPIQDKGAPLQLMISMCSTAPHVLFLI